VPTLAEIMHSDVFNAEPQTSVAEVAKIMVKRRLG